MKRRLLLAIACMKGGGAERVLSRLGNEFSKRQYEVEMLVTSSEKQDIEKGDLQEEIPITVLQERLKADNCVQKMGYFFLGFYARVFCKLFEGIHKPIPAHFSYASFIWQYHREISEMRRILTKDPTLTVIAFLPPTIPIVLLAARGLPNKVIISERGNTERQMQHRYGSRFIEHYYDRANHIVFQSDSAMSKYPRELWDRSTVIFNPLKEGLPKAFYGVRKNKIVTFCRISVEKNLPMLVCAFAKVYRDFPDYELNIYGNVQNSSDEKVYRQLIKQIKDMGLSEVVKLLPFCDTIHKEILDSAMYINTSNYEGMCNAMLEAIAIGVPSICTDCPAGGARAIIQSGVNGILVPVGDVEKLYVAMREIIEDGILAEKISANGQKLREDLSMEKIAKQWERLLK